MAEPFPIVDAHQHFWDIEANYHPWLRDEPPIPFRYGDYRPIRRRYLPADYFADVGPHQVVKTVYVEAEWDPTDPIGETRYIERLRRETGFPTVMVAQAWLDRADCAAVLEQQAGFDFVRSIRHKPRANGSSGDSSPGGMTDSAWRAGYARLAPLGLRFDLQTPWWHLAEAAALARDFPDTTIILNHAGLPSDRGAEAIAGWQRDGRVDAVEAAVLVASVIETADMLANTASVYGAYLKQVKKSAQAAFVLRLPRLPRADGRPHEAHQLDALALVQGLGRPVDVLYMDPPYNQRQYHANYHVLETLARWDLDAFEPRGKTGLRPGDDQRSPFCSSRQVAGAFEALVMGADARHVLVSYSEEGLLPEADLVALLERKGQVDLHTIAYKRFRADSDHAQRRYKSDVVREFLFWTEAGRP